MVANELKLPEDRIDQEDIDRAILDCLEDPIVDEVDDKKAKVKKSISAGDKGKPKKSPKSKTSPSTKKTIKEKQKPTSDRDKRTIDRLKQYIHKCGMRKNWKRELDGMSGKQVIGYLNKILSEDLGMEGRPTLEKCARIKREREFADELKELGIVRESGDHASIVEDHSSNKRAMVIDSSSDSSD